MTDTREPLVEQAPKPERKPPKNFGDEAPSAVFVQAATASATNYAADCDCGRTHFVWGGSDKEEDDRWEERIREYPDHYVAHEVWTEIHIAHVNGQAWVVDCPCNGLLRFEEWIWSHRELVVDYVRARVAEELKEAENQAKRLHMEKLIKPAALRPSKPRQLLNLPAES